MKSFKGFLAGVAIAIAFSVGAVVSGPSNLPAGTCVDFAGTSAPAGWIVADGSAISRTGANGAIFAALGTTWGAGNGTTTFNMPDFRRRATIGSGGTATFGPANTVGSVGGEEGHTQSIAEMPSHNHGGATGGGTTGTVSSDHTHAVSGSINTYSATGGGAGGFIANTDGSGGGNTGIGFSGGTGGISANHTHSIPALSISAQGSGSAFNQFQPSAVVLKICKQ